MLQVRLVAAIIVIGIAQVESFGNAAGGRRAQVHSLLGPTNPLSSSFRRSKATVLRYRNSPQDTGTDHYATLGVPRTANELEIKRAYRNLAKKFHPDANPDMDTTAIFQELNRAYETLKNPELKQKYDMTGFRGMGNPAANDRAAAAAADRVRNAPRPGAGYVYNQHSPGSGPFGGRSDPFHNHDPFNLHQRQPYKSSPFNRARPVEPQPQRPKTPFGESPFEPAWDPWKSPFEDVYNARIRDEMHEINNRQGMYDTSFSNMGAPGVQNGPSPGTMGDYLEFTTIRPNGGRGTGTRQRWVGGDLSIEMEIDLQTALQGGEEKIRIKHLASCTPCTGNGIQPGAEVKLCEHCHGSGAVLSTSSEASGFGSTQNHSTRQELCRPCRGTGQTVAENCGTCHGKGISEASKEIKVMIPAGVGDGAKLRLKGQGDAGPMGGPAGDLFIFLKIKRGDDPHGRMP